MRRSHQEEEGGARGQCPHPIALGAFHLCGPWLVPLSCSPATCLPAGPQTLPVTPPPWRGSTKLALYLVFTRLIHSQVLLPPHNSVQITTHLLSTHSVPDSLRAVAQRLSLVSASLSLPTELYAQATQVA